MPLSKLLFPPDSRSYNLRNGDDVVEISVEGGKARRRRDYSRKPVTISVKWVFKLEEYQYFMAFYNTALKKGSLPFLIDLIVHNPFPEEYEASIVSGTLSAEEPVGLAINVECDLEVLPKLSTNFDTMVLYLYDKPNYLNILQQLTNYDLQV
jgi:hypothetical protein